MANYIRNFRWEVKDGKTYLYMHNRPQYALDINNVWIDLEVEYADVIPYIEEPIYNIPESIIDRYNQYIDIYNNFYLIGELPDVIVDTNNPNILDAWTRTDSIKQIEEANGICYPREMVWVDGAPNITGIIILPHDDYDKVYTISEDGTIEYLNEYIEGMERPYYIKENGKTYMYVNHFSGGAGTQADPYLISTPAELDAIRNNRGSYYKLTNDIDLSEWGNWSPIGTTAATAFLGELDGDGYTISNMSCVVTATTPYNVGFIGYSDGAVIKNIRFKDCYSSYTGGYTGTACTAVGVGYLHYTILDQVGFDDCTCSTGSKGSENGIATGHVYNSTNATYQIKNCYVANSTITTTKSNGNTAAFGYGQYANFLNCYSAITVGGTVTSAYKSSFIENSATVSGCYFDNTLLSTSDKGTGMNTASMQTQSTFVGWDFDNIWYMSAYPALRVIRYKSKLIKFSGTNITNGFINEDNLILGNTSSSWTTDGNKYTNYINLTGMRTYTQSTGAGGLRVTVDGVVVYDDIATSTYAGYSTRTNMYSGVMSASVITNIYTQAATGYSVSNRAGTISVPNSDYSEWISPAQEIVEGTNTLSFVMSGYINTNIRTDISYDGTTWTQVPIGGMSFIPNGATSYYVKVILPERAEVDGTAIQSLFTEFYIMDNPSTPGSSTISITENILNGDQSTLSLTENIQSIGSSTLPLVENIPSTPGSSSITTNELIIGSGTSNLPINERIMTVGAVNLPLNERIVFDNAIALPLNEKIIAAEQITLPLNERIYSARESSNIPLTEVVNDPNLILEHTSLTPLGQVNAYVESIAGAAKRSLVVGIPALPIQDTVFYFGKIAEDARMNVSGEKLVYFNYVDIAPKATGTYGFQFTNLTTGKVLINVSVVSTNDTTTYKLPIGKYIYMNDTDSYQGRITGPAYWGYSSWSNLYYRLRPVTATSYATVKINYPTVSNMFQLALEGTNINKSTITVSVDGGVTWQPYEQYKWFYRNYNYSYALIKFDNTNDITIINRILFYGKIKPSSNVSTYEYIVSQGSSNIPINENVWLGGGQYNLPIQERITVEDKKELLLNEFISAGMFTSLPMTELIKGTSSIALPSNERILTVDSSNLPITEIVKTTGQLSLPLEERILMSNYSSIPLEERVAKLGSSSASITERVVRYNVRTLPIKVGVIDANSNVLPVNERVLLSETTVLPIIETIIKGGHVNLTVKERIKSHSSKSIDVVEDILRRGKSTVITKEFVYDHKTKSLKTIEYVKSDTQGYLPIRETIYGVTNDSLTVIEYIADESYDLLVRRNLFGRLTGQN